jgi:tenellin biosynthesis cytochrome P450 monooxygenase
VPGFGTRAEIIMPENAVEWAMAQPDDVLSVTDAFLEVNQTEYSLGHSRYWGDPWQFKLVKSQLNAILSNLIPAMDEELGLAFDKHLGTDTENWREVPLEATLRKVVSQATSRFTVGESLCRDESYLDLTYDIIDGVMFTAFASGTFPGFLRPLAGRLSSWQNRRKINQVKRIFEPLFRERLQTMQYDKNDPDHPEPQDQLQMMLRFAQKKKPEELTDLDIIGTRLCASNFVSMHQSTITCTNMILNIVASDAEYDTMDALRKEADTMLADGRGWSKEKFNMMRRADSVARETMRVNFPFGNRGQLRKVMQDGVETKDGLKLKKGAMISFLASPAQMDPDHFDNPTKYDPWRFSRPQESTGSKDAQTGAGPNAFVTTSAQYLPFGHGRHACPGRFLVDVELKMIVAYLLKHYDVQFPPQYHGQRPPNVWIAELAIPPPGAKVQVRRRKGPE